MYITHLELLLWSIFKISLIMVLIAALVDFILLKLRLRDRFYKIWTFKEIFGIKTVSARGGGREKIGPGLAPV